MDDPHAAKRCFGKAIRSLRLERGLSQERVALDGDLDRSYVGSVERGERNPTLLTMLRLAAGLGRSPAELLARFEEVRRAQRDDRDDG